MLLTLRSSSLTIGFSTKPRLPALTPGPRRRWGLLGAKSIPPTALLTRYLQVPVFWAASRTRREAPCGPRNSLHTLSSQRPAQRSGPAGPSGRGTERLSARSPASWGTEARRGGGASEGHGPGRRTTHQSPVGLRVRPLGGRRRVLGVAQALAGGRHAASGSHGNAAGADAVRRGAAYETAAGTN